MATLHYFLPARHCPIREANRRARRQLLVEIDPCTTSWRKTVFCRRAQLRQCLEQLKKQVPLSSDSMRNTTLNLLRRAQLHIKKLQEQDERAEQLKDRLRWEQRELRVRLEQLQRGAERMRNDSQGSTMSSERSDSDREDVEVDVESIVFDCMDSEEQHVPCGAADHCYSTMDKAWL
ncbi:max dimerization protein 3 isoform X4 [Corythoichthys intestinalis]|uniref:max dimerization protein 3 isoform X4 n=1 Tax=Corythoichthys intestinalis TaxID=161448 RepID=UPI0025A540A4|nr:max dimerization protein 3 isoform X4 [Corythoichthys intestinalis]XP_057706911.1 max dimerization protein 3 isoform X4 [Corythoichthys intestinalis]XP_057706912.1 max dimerization protein 3 isoform X4 [Corythoichthys intestinalis]XP_057706913.1 max dimerization protein 3 isoform X4 [Corythoichthys intestinalis]